MWQLDIHTEDDFEDDQDVDFANENPKVTEECY